jgi:RNA recognition motif-containing protein
MGAKLFVGGLSWDTNDAGLREAFEPFGEIVEAKVVTDRDTGRSRGFGFVSYADEASAKTALAQMNGQMLDGRSLKVDVAAEKGGGGGRGGGGGFRGGRDRY